MTRLLAQFVVLVLTANSVFAQWSRPAAVPSPKIVRAGDVLPRSTLRDPRDAVTTVSLTDRNSWDFYLEPVNERATVDLGALLGTPGGAAHVTGIGWDTVLESYSPSFPCDAYIILSDRLGVGVAPITDCFPTPGGTHYTSDGIFPLIDLGLDFVVEDGLLNLEWFEWMVDDFPGAIDATYHSGELTIEFSPVPEPSSAATLLVAIVMTLIRRRRWPA